MAKFIYKAYDPHGGKIDGQIEASSLEIAKGLLNRQKMMVATIKEAQSSEAPFSISSTRKVSSRGLEFFTSELSLLLNSGVTIDRALTVLGRSTSSASQARLIANLHSAIRQGETLSQAMSSEHAVFSALYINLVNLGESSGTLPQIFERLSDDIKFQSELKRKVVTALTYPSIVFIVCLLCIVFIFNYIVPQMSTLFVGLPEVPTYTSFLLNASEWVMKYQWFALFVVIALVVAFSVMIKTPTGSRIVDDMVLKLPGLSNVLLLAEQIRFNTAISMMLASGVMIDRCLEMGLGTIKNDAIRQNLEMVKDRVKKGESLANALVSSPMFPDFSISLIEVGEESGQLEPVFSELSSRARNEFEDFINRFTSLLEPILILIMGGIVGGVVVTMLVSIVSINDIGI